MQQEPAPPFKTISNKSLIFGVVSFALVMFYLVVLSCGTYRTGEHEDEPAPVTTTTTPPATTTTTPPATTPPATTPPATTTTTVKDTIRELLELLNDGTYDTANREPPSLWDAENWPTALGTRLRGNGKRVTEPVRLSAGRWMVTFELRGNTASHGSGTNVIVTALGTDNQDMLLFNEIAASGSWTVPLAVGDNYWIAGDILPGRVYFSVDGVAQSADWVLLVADQYEHTTRMRIERESK